MKDSSRLVTVWVDDYYDTDWNQWLQAGNMVIAECEAGAVVWVMVDLNGYINSFCHPFFSQISNWT